VDAVNVRLSGLSADEVDTSGSVIVLPEAIRPERPVSPVETPSQTMGADWPAVPAAQPEPTLSVSVPYNVRPTRLRLSMSMNRHQLFAAWNAFKNLAEAVGEIRITLEAQKPEGFDPAWLRNALYEPLDEADIEVDQN